MPQNNEELLRGLIEKYARMYMKMAVQMGVPYADAEDVVMEAFWSFYKTKYFGTLCEEESKAILTRIVANKCIDHMRKNRNKNALELDGDIGGMEFLYHSGDNDPLQSLVEKEQYDDIRKSLNELKETWRDVAVMHFIEGYSIEEISGLLGISRDICRSRISRVRKYLRKKFQGRWGTH